MNIELTHAELRSLASFDALRKPTFADCTPIITFEPSAAGTATATMRDRYRAVRLHLSDMAQLNDAFSIPLEAARTLARAEVPAAQSLLLSYDHESGIVTFGDAVHHVDGVVPSASTSLDELFAGDPDSVGGVAYRVNVELSAAVQRLSTPTDFLTRSRSHLWSVSLLRAGSHMRLLHRRGPVELVLQAAGGRLPDPIKS